MKKLFELKEEIEDSLPIGEKFKNLPITKSIVLKLDDDGDVSFRLKENGASIGWIGSKYFENTDNDDVDVKSIATFIANNFFSNVSMFIELAEWLGAEIPETLVTVKETEVEKEVIKEVSSSEEHKLAGMVEAYEKILLGRDVNISK